MKTEEWKDGVNLHADTSNDLSIQRRCRKRAHVRSRECEGCDGVDARLDGGCVGRGCEEEGEEGWEGLELKLHFDFEVGEFLFCGFMILLLEECSNNPFENVGWKI